MTPTEQPEDIEFRNKLVDMRFQAACAALRKMEAGGSPELYVIQAFRVADRMLVELFGEQTTGIPLRKSIDAIAIIRNCEPNDNMILYNYYDGYAHAKEDAINAIATAATKRKDD